MNQYEELVGGYRQWLAVLNYSKRTVYYDPREASKFMDYQAGYGRDFADWAAKHFHQYMEYTEQRPNERRGGGISPAHLNKIASALQRFQRYLVETNQGSIYTKIKRYKPLSKPLEILSMEQIAALYDACDSTLLGARHRVLLGLCYGCGLRCGEACGLKIDDIWWERSLLQIPQSKTGKSRLVPITPKVWKDLSDYVQSVRPQLLNQANHAQVLLTVRGGPTNHGVLYKSFKGLLGRLDLPQRGLHLLRHSIASHLAASGMASHHIAQFLGHQTLDSTQIYTHLQPTIL